MQDGRSGLRRGALGSLRALEQAFETRSRVGRPSAVRRSTELRVGEWDRIRR